MAKRNLNSTAQTSLKNKKMTRKAVEVHIRRYDKLIKNQTGMNFSKLVINKIKGAGKKGGANICKG